MHKRPLAVICIFFIIGIVLGRFLPEAVKFIHIFIVTLVFILSAVIFSRIDSRFRGNDKARGNDNSKITRLFILLSVASFAALLYVKSNIFPDNHISHVLGEERLKTEIIGVIKSPVLTRKPYYGKISSTYLFETEKIGYTDVTGLAQIRIQTEKDCQYGDRLLVKGTIRKPAEGDSRFRGNDKKGRDDKPRGSKFNYREYLERQNIFALVNTKEKNITVLAHDYKSNPILKYTYLLREKLKNQIIEKMPLETGAFMRAILLGDRSELPKHIQTSFKNSGTMHIFPIQNRQKLSYSS